MVVKRGFSVPKMLYTTSLKEFYDSFSFFSITSEERGSDNSFRMSELVKTSSFNLTSDSFGN